MKALMAPITPSPSLTKYIPIKAIARLEIIMEMAEICNFCLAINMASTVWAKDKGSRAKTAKRDRDTLNLSASKIYKIMAKTANKKAVKVNLNIATFHKSSDFLLSFRAISLIKNLLNPKSAIAAIKEKYAKATVSSPKPDTPKFLAKKMV